jgi:hypothetical protein
MTVPKARGGQAKAVKPPGPPTPPAILRDTYASLPSTAKIGLRSIPPGPPGVGSVDLILDEVAPILAGGGGGWEVTDRRGRMGLTSWTGVDPHTLEFTAILDARFAGKPDIEDDVKELEAMWSPRGDFNAPRHVRVVGASPGTSLEWLINGLVMQPSIRTADGKRRIQPVEIKLLEFVDPDSVIRATKAASDASHRKHRYQVKAGDTLASIAKLKLGSAARADDIRRENLPALADPRSLKAKMWILIPAGKA